MLSQELKRVAPQLLAFFLGDEESFEMSLFRLATQYRCQTKQDVVALGENTLVSLGFQKQVIMFLKRSIARSGFGRGPPPPPGQGPPPPPGQGPPGRTDKNRPPAPPQQKSLFNKPVTFFDVEKKGVFEAPDRKPAPRGEKRPEGVPEEELVVNQQYQEPKGFGARRNGFGANKNGFGANANGFGANKNGFGANANGFGASVMLGGPQQVKMQLAMQQAALQGMKNNGLVYQSSTPQTLGGFGSGGFGALKLQQQQQQQKQGFGRFVPQFDINPNEEEEDDEEEELFNVEDGNIFVHNSAQAQTFRNILSNAGLQYNAIQGIHIHQLIPFIPLLEAQAMYYEEEFVDLSKSLLKKLKGTVAIERYNSNNGYFGASQVLGMQTDDVEGLEFQKDNVLHQLLRYLYSVVEKELESIEKMIEGGHVTFNSLWYLFRKESRVARLNTEIEDSLQGGKIIDVSYDGGVYYSSFNVQFKFIKGDGKKFSYQEDGIAIDDFKGLKALSDLKLVIIDKEPELYKLLMKRGALWAKYATGHHYLRYEGNMYRKRFWTTAEERASGRVMIDIAAYYKMSHQVNDGISNHGPRKRRHLSKAFNNSNNNVDDMFEVKPEDYWLCPPTVEGFSFVNKRWGEFNLFSLKQMTYNKEAFEMLVLEEHKKELINSLVTHAQKSFGDFIDHKGKGCIFLLHGPPGTGKTLTAEAIAEYLDRPLYPVSVGELGTDPIKMEQSLADVMELATIWNAVVLVDEADIFLERRNKTDIVRNAMVGIFLRTIEYFQGVLFLTSNRVRCLDRAFHSRVSVALKYPSLNAKSRAVIWRHFMKIVTKTFSIDQDPALNLDDLTDIEINGRQIRSVMRLAASLAIDEKSPTLTERHIRECIQISNHFEDFVASSNIAQMMNESVPEKDSALNKPVWVNDGKTAKMED